MTTPSPPTRPTTAYDALERTLAETGADAFVHVGDRFDDDLLYLTRFGGPDRDYAFVYVDGSAELCAPRLFAEQAIREFPGDVVHATGDQAAVSAPERALEAIAAHLPSANATVLVTPSLSVDAYRALSAGVAEVVVEAVDLGRASKSAAERECHAFVQAATQRGMARAECVLAEATIRGEELRWDGEPLTTERLRREVNATLAAAGVSDVGNTVIGAGESCADLHFTGEDGIAPHETVLLDISPRGPRGYYGDLTRTFVVGDVGEWERTAYDAVTEAQDAALEMLEAGAGTPVATVSEAATDVLAERGFESGDVDVGMYHGLGHGVGVSLHESPSFSGDSTLEAGHVVTVEPGVYDPARGGVRIEDLVVVTDSGYENFTAYPREIRPEVGRSRVTDAANH